MKREGQVEEILHGSSRHFWFPIQRPLHGFQTGMKLEAVDKRNPMLIRVATVADTEDHRLKVPYPALFIRTTPHLPSMVAWGCRVSYSIQSSGWVSSARFLH